MTGAEKLRRSLGCALNHLNNAVTNPTREEMSLETRVAIDAAENAVAFALRLAREQA